MTADDLAREVAGLLDKDIHRRYLVIKAGNEQKFTLGVAYPANEVDVHGDFATAQELERAAWSATARNISAGVGHQDGTDNSGVIVESYIHRGPVMKIGDETVKPGDWMLGVVWNERTWAKIKAGELTGYSIQGIAATREGSP